MELQGEGVWGYGCMWLWFGELGSYTRLAGGNWVGDNKQNNLVKLVREANVALDALPIELLFEKWRDEAASVISRDT